jgi:hypothetical protein
LGITLQISAVLAQALNVPLTSDGWSNFRPNAATSKLYYISSSGVDSTGCIYTPAEVGTNPFRPTNLSHGTCRTLQYVYQTLMTNVEERSGHPDYILFKNNDTFSYSSDLGFSKSGSATEYMVIGNYVDPSAPTVLTRPTMSLGSSNPWITFRANQSHMKNVAVVNLHLERPLFGTNSVGAIDINQGGVDPQGITNIYLENNYFDKTKFDIGGDSAGYVC